MQRSVLQLLATVSSFDNQMFAMPDVWVGCIASICTYEAMFQTELARWNMLSCETLLA